MNGCKKTRALMDAVKKSGGGKVQTSADTARKLATEMGGMKKGGKPKPGLAVMIAIGKAKPEKKAVGGAGKVRKDQAPIKRKEGGEAKKKGYSLSDRNAARTAMPGTKRQVPADDTIVYTPDGKRIADVVTMNYAGIAGGLPTTDAQALRNRARFEGDVGNTASASAAKIRASNVEGHNKATEKTKSEIKLRQLKAAADKPGASQYDKDRYRYALKSGMVGPVSRKEGGTTKRSGMPREGISTRPTTSGGRRITMKEMEQAGRDFGGMTAAQIKAAGEAVARGNREPYEPIPKAKGGAAKVRKGMMSQSGDIRQAVKPKKGIGGIM